MILAAAQTKPKRRDIEHNLNDHYLLCEKAFEHNVDLIVFPELSISGYERENAHKYIFSPFDPRLQYLKDIAVSRKLIIIAGAPVEMDNKHYIGTFILFPNGETSIYTKQYLHTGEEQFYSSSFDFNPRFSIENAQFSLATCADIETKQHIIDANDTGSKFYVPSIFYTPGSIQAAHDKLSNYAKEFKMHILMSNFCGESYGSPAAGRSAFWNINGKLIAQMDDKHTGLLILDNGTGSWKGGTIDID
jgi:predicted amidohydrolase